MAMDFFVWQGQEDSNPRPTVLETGTLPAELYPYISIPVYYITLFWVFQPLLQKFFLFFYCVYISSANIFRFFHFPNTKYMIPGIAHP